MGSVFVDLSSRFVASSVATALNYLPLMKFDPGVVEWLDKSLVAGSVSKGELLWQGLLDKFPTPKTTGASALRLPFRMQCWITPPVGRVWKVLAALS